MRIIGSSLALAGAVFACQLQPAQASATVSGIGIASYSAASHSMRLFKINNTHVDSAYDLATGSQYSGIAVNTHGTHVAFWKKTRAGADSSFTSTDWRKVLALQDDAALYMMGRYLSPATAASVTGCTLARAKQLKASLDSAGNLGGSTELWPVDQMRWHQPDAWNFGVYYDSATNTWSRTVTSPTQEYRLILMRIDNPQKTIDLVVTGRDLNSWMPPGTLAWPQGDWIYFSSYGMGYRFLYRVNVQTRTIEFVTLIDSQWRMIYPGIPCCLTADDFKMSTLGSIILLNHTGLMFSLAEILAAKGSVNFGNWVRAGGCGQTISASGNVGGCQYGPGHNDYELYSFVWPNWAATNTFSTTPAMRNRWSLDRNDPQLACTIHDPLSSDTAVKIVESVGVGQATGGHNFAVNSDKWFCLLSGWAPAGRFGNNGQNFILCNFNDSVTLNVSRGPRNPNTSFGTVEPQCYTQSTGYFVDEAHFFVKTPPEDIVPALQADATTNYTVPGLDDNTQLPALTMMPLTPYGGLTPAQVVVPGGRGSMTVTDAAMAPVKTCVDAAGLRVDIGSSLPHTVSVFDARGALIARRCGTGYAERFAPGDGLRPGLYVVSVTVGSHAATISSLVTR